MDPDPADLLVEFLGIEEEEKIFKNGEESVPNLIELT